MTSINYSDSTPDVTFTYNRLGRQATVVDAVGTRTFAYNSALQLSTETFSGGILTRIITRGYSTSGVLGRYNNLQVGVSGDPDQDYDVDYYYDAKGRLGRIDGPGLPSYGAEYTFLTNSDMVEKTEFKSDASTVVASATRTFESTRDLLTAVENKYGATTLSKYEYVNDDLGRRTSVVQMGTAFTTDFHRDFTYNDRSELLTSKKYNNTTPGSTTNPITAQHFTFSFDPIGNRVDYTGEDPQVTTNYTNNNVNQYTSIDEESDPDWSITYDFDGNTTQDDEFDYSWDAENRLVTVVPRSPITGSLKSVFTYDYMGRRVRKQIYLYAGGQWNSTPTIDRKFIYDQWNLLVELNALSSDAVLEKYTWGLDLAGQRRMGVPPVGTSFIPGLHDAGGIGGLLSMRDVGTTTSLMYMYSTNGDVGQLVKVTDGSFGAKYQYYPYGGEIQAVGSYAATNPFRFSTKYWDGEHQAYYYGHRYHKPKLGRWLSRDPLSELGGINLYVHTANAPLSRFDPYGLEPPPPPDLPVTHDAYMQDCLTKGYSEQECEDAWNAEHDMYVKVCMNTWGWSQADCERAWKDHTDPPPPPPFDDGGNRIGPNDPPEEPPPDTQDGCNEAGLAQCIATADSNRDTCNDHTPVDHGCAGALVGIGTWTAGLFLATNPAGWVVIGGAAVCGGLGFLGGYGTTTPVNCHGNWVNDVDICYNDHCPGGDRSWYK